GSGERSHITAEGKDHVGPGTRQIARETGKPVRLPLRIAVLEEDVPSFGVAKITQPCTKGRQTRISFWRPKKENADAGNLPALLRLDHERRGEEAAHDRNDETAAS